MIFLIIIVAMLFLVYFLSIIKKYVIIASILNDFENTVEVLAVMFNIYVTRKKIIEDKNLNYDSQIKHIYDQDDFYFITDCSQRECTEAMYQTIQKLDKLIETITNYGFSSDEYGLLKIDNSVNIFYELRRKIRTERLINENHV